MNAIGRFFEDVYWSLRRRWDSLSLEAQTMIAICGLTVVAHVLLISFAIVMGCAVEVEAV